MALLTFRAEVTSFSNRLTRTELLHDGVIFYCCTNYSHHWNHYQKEHYPSKDLYRSKFHTRHIQLASCFLIHTLYHISQICVPSRKATVIRLKTMLCRLLLKIGTREMRGAFRVLQLVQMTCKMCSNFYHWYEWLNLAVNCSQFYSQSKAKLSMRQIMSSKDEKKKKKKKKKPREH